jgi:alpha-ketoglutarate-dependent 2,4-dichlorophenoxyacetate dioxygenase
MIGHVEIFDVSNLNDDGTIAELNTRRYYMNRGNSLWHTDSSFNPRRAGVSVLHAVSIPPPGLGGETQFADARTAYAEMPDDLKEELLSHEYVANHTIMHSRKTASPEYFTEEIDPLTHNFSKHKIVQTHEPSGRKTLYIAAHAHSIEGLPVPEGQALIKRVMDHVTQPKYVLKVEWLNDGDMVLWDNCCVRTSQDLC